MAFLAQQRGGGENAHTDQRRADCEPGPVALCFSLSA
jgi:hypothetical protein